MERIPDALANATLQDEKGASVTVQSLLEKPVVLVFLRHFG